MSCETWKSGHKCNKFGGQTVEYLCVYIIKVSVKI